MGFKVPKDPLSNVASVYLRQITQGRLFSFSIKHSVVKLCDSAPLGARHISNTSPSHCLLNSQRHLMCIFLEFGSAHNHLNRKSGFVV